MITYKVVLDERRQKADGKFPIIFRVTFNRSTNSYATGISICKDHWNFETSLINRFCPNYKELNKNLTNKYLALQKVILQMEDDGEFSFDLFKERLIEKHDARKASLTFLEYSEQLIAEMRAIKRVGNAIVYQTAVNRVIQFAGNKKLNFKQIDFNFLDGFKFQLIKEGAKPNTIGNYLRSIRAIYNKAIKAKLIDRSLYPFNDITIKTEKTAKRAISSDALTELGKVPLKIGSQEWHARNYLVLSFSLIGISFTDAAYLKTHNVSKGRLAYKRRKTHKHYNIKLSQLSINILSYYKSNGEYLLPVLSDKIEEDSLESKKIIQQWIKTTNKYLKRLGKQCGIENLTTYVARHTWATTAKRLGYSIELIAEAMGHEHGNKITNIYLDNFDQSLIDDLNEKVIASIS